MCTDEAMWECQIQFPKLSPRCEVSSSNNSCGIERAFRRPRARPRGGARLYGPGISVDGPYLRCALGLR